MEARSAMAEVGLLPFARIALEVSKAVLPRYRSRFSNHQFTQPYRFLQRLDDQIIDQAVGETVRLLRHAEKESPASQGRRGRDGLGARSSEHVLCAVCASPRAKTVALAALVEVVW